MKNPEKPKAKHAKESSGRIEPLKLKEVNSVRHKVNHLLRRMAVVGGLGLATGAGAGAYSQHVYRDWIGYHPEPVAEAVAEEQIVEAEDPGLLDQAEKALSDATQWAREKIGSKAKKNKLVQQYRDTKKELLEIKNKMLRLGDKTAFWVPFLLTFLATVVLAGKIIETKKYFSESVDPEVEANLGRIQSKINELVDRVNTMKEKELRSEGVQEGLSDEMARLVNDFGDLEKDVEG
jgi:hypothetical protein